MKIDDLFKLLENDISESFDSPASIDYYTNNNYEFGTFTVNNIEYIVGAAKDDDGMVFAFTRADSQDNPNLDDILTGDNKQSAIVIYSTVVEFIKVKLAEDHPDAWYIDYTDDKKGNFYKKIITKFRQQTKNIGYTCKFYPDENKWIFYKLGITPREGYDQLSETANFFTRMKRNRHETKLFLKINTSSS